jgi:hypothetical protein
MHDRRYYNKYTPNNVFYHAIVVFKHCRIFESDKKTGSVKPIKMCGDGDAKLRKTMNTLTEIKDKGANHIEHINSIYKYLENKCYFLSEGAMGV